VIEGVLKVVKLEGVSARYHKGRITQIRLILNGNLGKDFLEDWVK